MHNVCLVVCVFLFLVVCVYLLGSSSVLDDISALVTPVHFFCWCCNRYVLVC